MAETSIVGVLFSTDLVPSQAEESYLEDSSTVFGTFILAMTLICIITSSFVGNCLIFLIAYKKPALLTIANRYILHLAVCQFGMTVLVMPSTLVSVFAKQWVFSQGWCVFTAFCKFLLLTSIILTLVLISVERYISISRPMMYQSSFVVKYWYIILLTVWVVSTFMAIPPMLGWSEITYSGYQYACSVSPVAEGHGYILFVFFLGFLGPFLFMSYVYVKIYIEGRKLILRLNPSQRSIKTDPSSGQDSGSREGTEKQKKWVVSEWRIAKTGVMVVTAYAICWFPAFMVMIFYLDGQHRPWWATFSVWMSFCSCALNPYVYVFRSRTMRIQASLLLARITGKDIVDLKSESVTVPVSQAGSSIPTVVSKKRYQKVPSFKEINANEESIKKECDEQPEHFPAENAV